MLISIAVAPLNAPVSTSDVSSGFSTPSPTPAVFCFFDRSHPHGYLKKMYFKL